MPPISVRGAREHNLAGVDLDIERDRLVVLTGVSGSGKSSFAFGTLFAEAQRRFVEALAPQARGRFGVMRKPAFDQITGLIPALGLSQRGQAAPSPRATVGTLTEVHDLLRVVWARVGIPHCPVCGRRIDVATLDDIVRWFVGRDGARVTVCAPVARSRAGDPTALLGEIGRQGFTRVRIDAVVLALDEVPPIDRKRPHDIDIVVDRIKVTAEKRDRVQDAVETTLRAGRGSLVAVTDDGETTWNTRPRCIWDDLALPDLAPRLFSFNAPVGACPTCQGVGTVTRVEMDRLIDPDATIEDGAVDGGRGVVDAVRERGVPIDVPWRELTWEQRSLVLDGDASWEGARALAVRRGTQGRASARLTQALREETCQACGGARLGDAARAVRVDGRTLPELLAAPLEEARAWLAARPDSPVVTPLRDELVRRVDFLLRSGLGHLSLDRGATTLSAGELQRVRLGAQIGNQLSGVLYVLDEPTAGLHPRDTDALVRLLVDLRDAGNTVLVVEHDPMVIRAADRAIDFGPGAGRDGGRVVYDGTPAGLERADSVTGRWLAGREEVPRGHGLGGGIVIRGARGHNLRGIDVELPLGGIVAVTGVSGAGKSSLVLDTVGRAVARKLGGAAEPLAHDTIEGLDAITRLVTGEAGGFGRSTRANVATATKIWDDVRELYARTNEAKLRGFGADRFSFNTPGGRCEACGGEGVQHVDLHYLPSLELVCEVCDGRRYDEATLAVTWRGASIADVLDLPVREARKLFVHHDGIARSLRMLDELGLGYLPLGQPADTWSGGEAQRVRLARELARPGEVAGTLYLLDEPSVGLHPADVATLLRALRQVTAAGGSVIVVEHDPVFLRGCDRVIELGPGAGAAGGRVVAVHDA